jgi:predicted Zn-dependent protease with MMP-like domain
LTATPSIGPANPSGGSGDGVGDPPPNWSTARFLREVNRFVRSLPKDIRRALRPVMIDVEPRAKRRDRIEAGLSADPEGPDDDLLGLFVGLPVTERRDGDATAAWTVEDALPPRVIIYRKAILAVSRDGADVRRHLRETLLHELAHALGYSEEDLDEFESRTLLAERDPEDEH